MKGGIFIAQGADTCVYDPPVECVPGTQIPKEIPPGDYVSRLVVKSDKEVTNQVAVYNAIIEAQRKYPDIDLKSHVNLAVGMCEPKLKESDLKSAQGKYCNASQRKIDDISKGPTYANLITPRQEEDMHKLPKEFNREKLPALLHAIAYLNNENIVHTDAHTGNIAKMGDKLVLHDWGRVIIGLKKFKIKMIMLLQNKYEKEVLQKRFPQWKFPCDLLDVCIVPTSDDNTFHRFMKIYDFVSILGSVILMNIVDNGRITDVFHIASKILVADIHPNQMGPLVHAMIDYVFSDGPLPAVLQPYPPPPRAPAPPPVQVPRPIGTLDALSSITPVSTPLPSSPPPVRRNVPRLVLPPQAQGAPAGSGRKTAKKLCRCIKSVRKTIKTRPGISKEKGAIAICVKSVVQTKRSTLKKFKCGKKPRLITQRRKKVGGATPVPDEVAWERFYRAYDDNAEPYDKAIWGALQSSNVRYVSESNAAKVFLGVAVMEANPELIDIMYKKGATYADFVNRIDDLRRLYPDIDEALTRSKQIVQKYQS